MKSLYLKTEEAVGKVLCHDITKIVKDTFKGVAFKKGHVIRKEDVDELLRLGKSHIALIELDPLELHEEEAGLRLAQAIKGPGIVLKGPSEGRFDLIAETRGLLKIKTKPLLKINRIPRVVVATLHTMTPVLQGEKVAGTKVVPLAIEERVIRKVETICAADGPVLSVLPYRRLKVGAVITGREVCESRIEDGFGQVLKEKCAFFGLEPPALMYCVDDATKISAAINEHLGQGCELILATGGMSVSGYMRLGPASTRSKRVVPSSSTCRVSGATASRASRQRHTTSSHAVCTSRGAPHTNTRPSCSWAPRAVAARCQMRWATSGRASSE